MAKAKSESGRCCGKAVATRWRITGGAGCIRLQRTNVRQQAVNHDERADRLFHCRVHVFAPLATSRSEGRGDRGNCPRSLEILVNHECSYKRPFREKRFFVAATLAMNSRRASIAWGVFCRRGFAILC